MKPGAGMDVSRQAPFVAGYREVSSGIVREMCGDNQGHSPQALVAFANHGNPSGPYRKS